uniref:Uncharacterized protein n=1 Tax=Romanomermis culicivorax TaxID=13658 RepID=A0A915HYY8_ROMCU
MAQGVHPTPRTNPEASVGYNLAGLLRCTDFTNQSTIGNSTHYQMDQLTSATPCTIDITPRAKTHQKTTGPSTARRHLYLDVDYVSVKKPQAPAGDRYHGTGAGVWDIPTL